MESDQGASYCNEVMEGSTLSSKTYNSILFFLVVSWPSPWGFEWESRQDMKKWTWIVMYKFRFPWNKPMHAQTSYGLLLYSLKEDYQCKNRWKHLLFPHVRSCPTSVLDTNELISMISMSICSNIINRNKFEPPKSSQDHFWKMLIV